MEQPTQLETISTSQSVLDLSNAYRRASSGKERNAIVRSYLEDEDHLRFARYPLCFLLFVHLTIFIASFFVSSDITQTDWLFVHFLPGVLTLFISVDFLFSVLGHRKTKPFYLKYKDLKRTPEEERVYLDPYARAASEIRHQVVNLNGLIEEWNVYVKRRYRLQVVEHDERLEELYPVLLRSRETIVRESERLCELMVIREENARAGTQKVVPVDLVDMRQRLEEVSTVIAASVQTNEEMREVDDDSGSTLEATAKLDAIQSDLGNELPEVKREKIRRLAARRAAGQPS